VRYFEVWNVTTGELVAVSAGASDPRSRLSMIVMSRSEEYAMLADFVAMMRREHRAGCAHVRECHEGLSQSYVIRAKCGDAVGN
jgi:hypothetical protein